MRKAKCRLAFLITVSIIIASAAATVQRSVPHSQLKRRNPIKPLPPPPPFRPIFNREQKQYLVAHNVLRDKMGVPPLSWDAGLTASARAWAVKRRADCDYRLHSPGKYGENLYWMNYNVFTPAQVVESWFSERKWYNRVRKTCACVPERNGCECGHFLNVVWGRTRRVGCSGAVYCDGNKGVYVVCQYDPAGLTKGVDPFSPSPSL